MPLNNRPVCPKCQTALYLARRTPMTRGRERRFFECAHCNETFIVEVADDDPIDRAEGWILGLRPPD